MPEPRRILIGLTEVAGFYRGLHAGFRELGIDADLMLFNPHPFQYDKAPGAFSLRVMQELARRQISSPASAKLRKASWFLLRSAMRPYFFMRALARYDVFIFGFGSSFLDGWDLPLLRMLGKTVVCQFHGSDSRPPYIDGTLMVGPGALTIDQAARAATKKKRPFAGSNATHRPASISRRRRTFTSAATSIGFASGYRRVRHRFRTMPRSKNRGGEWRPNAATNPSSSCTRHRIRLRKVPSASVRRSMRCDGEA
jgi:hypothetical protein